MAAIYLTADQTDDVAFLGLVEQIINGAVVKHQPADVRVFKIDHWFDHKWLGFSGKVLVALGVWSKKLTVPPFVANRIIDQWQYERTPTSGVYQLTVPDQTFIIAAGLSRIFTGASRNRAGIGTLLVQR